MQLHKVPTCVRPYTKEERTSLDFNEKQSKEGRKIVLFFFFNFVRWYLNHNWIVVFIPKLIIFINLKIKKEYFDLPFTFLATRESTQYSTRTYPTYEYFAHPIDLFPLPYFATGYIMNDFFMSPGFDSSSTDYINTNGKFTVICKPGLLNDGRWRLKSTQKT